jgi:hypothetical protein
LAADRENVHQAIDHFALIDMAPIAATPGFGNERLQHKPFRICHIAGVTQLAAVISMPVSTVHISRPPVESGRPSLDHNRLIRSNFRKFWNKLKSPYIEHLDE